jgi:hypothetical protein
MMKLLHAVIIAFLFSGSHSFAQDLVVNNSALRFASAKSAPTATDARHNASDGQHNAPDAQQWEKQKDQINGHISSGKLAKMKQVTNAIMEYFENSCFMEGQFTATWHGEYYSEKTSSGPKTKFGVQCQFPDQNANLSIMANDLGSMMDHLQVNGQTYLTIRPAVEMDKDHFLFDYTENNVRSTVWLISSAESQMPFIPVTRAEYLHEAKAELTAIKDAMIADIKKNIQIRPADIQMAEKNATLVELRNAYSGMDLEVRAKMLLGKYQTDEEYQNCSIKKETAALNGTIELMNNLLSHLSPDALNRPAIVSVNAVDFQGFEDGIGTKMLVRINPSWLAGTDGEKSPFFLISWQLDPSQHPSPNDIDLIDLIDRQLKEHFDGQKFKEAIQTMGIAEQSGL